MKGYDVSNDYEALWGFILAGYRVPCWVANNERHGGGELLMTAKYIDGRYSISGDWLFCGEGEEKHYFLKDCKGCNLSYLTPTKQ